jgi:hypothetical protein
VGAIPSFGNESPSSSGRATCRCTVRRGCGWFFSDKQTLRLHGGQIEHGRDQPHAERIRDHKSFTLKI